MSYSRSMVASTLLAATFMSCSAMADQINVVSWTSRIGNATGLTDEYAQAYIEAETRYGSQAFPSLARPNSDTNWDSTTATTARLGYTGTMNGASIESWMSSNYSGAWDVTYAGSSTQSFDTSPYYQSVTGREYLELSAASATQFENIVANGLTGTFTFELTAPHYSEGQGRAYISGDGTLAHGDSDLTYLNGSTFQLTIASALGADAKLVLQLQSGAFIGTFPTGDDAYMTWFGESVYGAASTPAVPGPMVIASLAGLGLARRRRR